MKKNKSIIILTVILILFVAGCIATYAVLDKPEYTSIEDRYKERLFAKKTRELSLPGDDLSTPDSKFYLNEIVDNSVGGKSIPKAGTKLKYKTSATYTSERSYDIYTDENDNEYSYDQAGMLTEFKLNNLTKDVNSANASNLLTEQEAIELAKKYAFVLYGDAFKDFELEWSFLSEEMHTYSFGFTKKLSFVSGPYCFIDICTNGLLFSCDLVGYSEYDDFDKSLLDGITEQDIYDFVKEQVSNQFTSTATEFNIKNIGIEKRNNKYSLIAVTYVVVGQGSDAYNVVKDYYYALN